MLLLEELCGQLQEDNKVQHFHLKVQVAGNGTVPFQDTVSHHLCSVSSPFLTLPGTVELSLAQLNPPKHTSNGLNSCL